MKNKEKNQAHEELVCSMLKQVPIQTSYPPLFTYIHFSFIMKTYTWHKKFLGRFLNQPWDFACLQQLSEGVSHNIEEK